MGKFLALHIHSFIKKNPFALQIYDLFFGFLVFYLIVLLLRKIVTFTTLGNLSRVSLPKKCTLCEKIQQFVTNNFFWNPLTFGLFVGTKSFIGVTILTLKGLSHLIMIGPNFSEVYCLKCLRTVFRCMSRFEIGIFF